MAIIRSRRAKHSLSTCATETCLEGNSHGNTSDVSTKCPVVTSILKIKLEKLNFEIGGVSLEMTSRYLTVL